VFLWLLEPVIDGKLLVGKMEIRQAESRRRLPGSQGVLMHISSIIGREAGYALDRLPARRPFTKSSAATVLTPTLCGYLKTLQEPPQISALSIISCHAGGSSGIHLLTCRLLKLVYDWRRLRGGVSAASSIDASGRLYLQTF
ncbi:hypothetical protein GOODEAATRI_013037, partial [Goodea atripinnis]